MNFEVKNPSSYDGNFPIFRKPSEIGHFSLDGDRQYQDDGRQMKYIVLPPRLERVHMDLNVRYADAVTKDFGKKEKIDILLTWILSHQDKVKQTFHDPNTNKLKISFVCFRGLLTNICNTVYEDKEDWLICATKFNSVIYLCAFDTEQAIRRRETANARDKLMCAWGYKFEQYLSADSPFGKPDLSIPVNEKEEYCITLKGRLNDHTLLFSAEVDGTESSKRHQSGDVDPTQSYTELKTSRIITTDRQDVNFRRYKLRKWWLQSFLVATPRIICGFRNDHGIVQKLEIFQVADIPKMAKGLWSPAASLNFCCQFLDYVKACVTEDNPSKVYKFYWKPGSPVTCEELSDPGEFQVLPEWYTQNLRLTS